MAHAHRRPPRPGVYQRHDDPIKRIAQAGVLLIRPAIADALKAFRKAVPAQRLATAIASRDIAGAADAINISTLKHDLVGAFKAIAAVHQTAAEHGAKQVTESIRAARARRVRKDRKLTGDRERPDRFAFDLYTDQVLADLQDMQDNLITAMTDDVRQIVFDAVAQGVAAGDDPADVADRIRDVITLNDRQAQAVENYRAALEDGSSRALDYALRDDASDADIRAALAAGQDLDQDFIDGLVDAYVDRSIDYRADMIAQTESVRASNKGLQDAYSQAIDNGVFPAEAVRQFWMVSLDEKTCDICQGIADDSEDGIPVGEQFDSDDGAIDAPPAHTNCRCGLEMRTNLDMVPPAADDEADE